MHGKPQKEFFSSSIAFVCLLVLSASGMEGRAASSTSNVLCRPELALERRAELAERLREITGWSRLRFNERGELRLEGEAKGGSQTARELLTEAAAGKNILVLEDASNRSDVIFARVVPGRWTRDAGSKPPAFIVLVDFADFAHVTGDRAALAAFNAGWGVLHEIAHVVREADDASGPDALGECEELINRMRVELRLPSRAEYFYTKFPGMEHSTFAPRYVRLAFEQLMPDTNKKRRFWLIWDARVVGELTQPATSAEESRSSSLSKLR